MYSIAIDGPSGAGKSTLAKRLANEFSWAYVDTGAIYRAVGLACERGDVCPTDLAAVSALLPALNVSLDYSGGSQRTLLNGQDVSDEIRRDDISKLASDVSALSPVRAYLLDLQRDVALENNVVMDGRDIATIVLPEATVKIYLTATPQVRAERRRHELLLRGENRTLSQVLDAIQKRDANDCQRAEAPLRQAEDAVLLDTTEMSLDDAFAALLEIVKGRISGLA
ncbi:MAG: (d)CMP kinase [Oscillospiraceae bacterium]|jgi:cytidylate kinase|nr:(d)CMP kinase [Oscillospiraceae bacterium]